MADFQATAAALDALLQEDYIQKDIADAINTATVFKNKLTRKSTLGGRRAVYPVQLGLMQGVGARAEMAPLPQYGAAPYLDATVNTFANYGRYIVSGQGEVFSSRNAFVDFVSRMVRDTKEGLTVDLGRQCWADGTGTIALVNGLTVAGSATITVKSAYGLAWGSAAANTTFMLKKNQQIQFGTENNGGQGYTITALTGTTITISPPLAANIADGARIGRVGAVGGFSGSAAAGVEIEGWLRMVATSAFMTTNLALASGVYHGIDRAANPDFEGNVTDAAAGALSLTNIRAIKDKLFKRWGVADLCITSTEQRAAYEALLVANQRFVPPMKLEGGYSALEHDGLPVVADKDAPYGAWNLVTSRQIQWLQRNDPEFIKQGDQVLQKVSGYDAKEAVLRWYSNLDTEQPRAQAMLFNLA
jgi:hypothetical protein